jgi:hypothetical protein
MAKSKYRSRSKKSKTRSKQKKKSSYKKKKRTRSRSKKRTRSRSKKRTRSRSKKRTRSRSKKRTRSRSKKRTKAKVKTRKSPIKILVNKNPVYSKKICPKGSISRKSFKRKDNVKVKASCVKSKSLRAKKNKPQVYLPSLKQGSLKKYGYSVHESMKKRHAALKKAIKKYGSLSTIKKLNAVKLLTKNTAPKNSKIYKKDIRYVQKITS